MSFEFSPEKQAEIQKAMMEARQVIARQQAKTTDALLQENRNNRNILQRMKPTKKNQDTHKHLEVMINCNERILAARESQTKADEPHRVRRLIQAEKDNEE